MRSRGHSRVRERTGAGRIAAKKRGVKFGRPPKLTPQQAPLVARLVDQGQSVPEVASTFGVREVAIYRCLAAREAANRVTDRTHQERIRPANFPLFGGTTVVRSG
jgi:DNA invertase Pin-like site-specific DNA recombinase